jgi:hypothetical protein
LTLGEGAVGARGPLRQSHRCMPRGWTLACLGGGNAPTAALRLKPGVWRTGPRPLHVVLSERELGRSGDAWMSRKAAATAASPDMLKSPRVPPARPRTHELSSARAGSSKDSRGFGGLEW